MSNLQSLRMSAETAPDQAFSPPTAADCTFDYEDDFDDDFDEDEHKAADGIYEENRDYEHESAMVSPMKGCDLLARRATRSHTAKEKTTPPFVRTHTNPPARVNPNRASGSLLPVTDREWASPRKEDPQVVLHGGQDQAQMNARDPFESPGFDAMRLSTMTTTESERFSSSGVMAIRNSDNLEVGVWVNLTGLGSQLAIEDGSRPVCDAMTVDNLLHPRLLYPLISIIPSWAVQDLLINAFQLCRSEVQLLDLFAGLVTEEIQCLSIIAESKQSARMSMFYEKSTFFKLCHAFHVVSGFQHIGYAISDAAISVIREASRFDILNMKSADEAEEKTFKIGFAIKSLLDVIITKFHALLSRTNCIYLVAMQSLSEIFSNYFKEYRIDSVMFFMLFSFVAPALMNPNQYGIYPFPLSDYQQQILSMISQILLKISLRGAFPAGPYFCLNKIIKPASTNYSVSSENAPKMSNFIEGFLDSPIISLEPFEAVNYGSIADEPCLQPLLSLIREHTIRLVKISPKCLSNLNKLQIVGLLRLPRDVVVTLKLMHSVIPDLSDHAVLQNLITLMKNEKLGIPVTEKVVKNSVIFGPRIEKCFTGSEAVDWFITHVSQFSSFQIDRRRPMAVEFGLRLLQMQILSSVGSSPTFRDNDSLYKFTERKSQHVLNSTILWGPSRAKPLEDVYDMLSRIMNLFDSHVSYYGEITKEALFCIKNTSKYREFCLLTSKLQQVNLNEFGENERLCFFINVYNTLNLHATVDAAEEFKLNRPLTFFQQACYDIGGQLYSLDDIEHGIIRGNSAATQLMGNISTSLKKIDRRDPRFPFVIKSPTAFVNFVLWSGYKSGPRVRIYHAESILLEMLEAAKEYIGGHFQFDSAKYEVTLPKIIDYNQQDFGGSRAAIVAWLKGNNVLCKSHILFLTASWCARSDHSVTFDHFYTSFQYHANPDYVLNTVDVSNYGWAMARRLRPMERDGLQPLPAYSPPATE